MDSEVFSRIRVIKAWQKAVEVEFRKNHCRQRLSSTISALTV